MRRRATTFIPWAPAAVAGVLAICLSGGPLAAQAQLDRLYPPVVAIGHEAIIRAEGKFAQWPVQIDHGREGLTVTPAEKSGELRVVVAPGTPPGVVWIRCFDDQSASGLVPLLIAPVAVTAESEPNNAAAEAPKVELPAVFAGRLEKRGDVDAFRVVAQAGQTLVASVIAHRPLGSPMDAVLQIADADGNVLAQSDDQRGLDPQIVYTATGDGELWIRVFAFPETPTSTIGFAGEASYVYAIRATTGPFVDHVLPLIAAEDTAAAEEAFGWNLPPKLQLSHAAATERAPRTVYWPSSLGWQWQFAPPAAEATFIMEPEQGTDASAPALPAVFSGHISQAGEVDAVKFPVVSGKAYRAEVRSRVGGFPLDSVLRVVDLASGDEVARNDDGSRSDYDAAVEFTAKKDGDLALQISDLVDAAGPRHAYSVWIAQATPDAALTVAADRFLLPAGGEVEIAVNVDRQRGFAQPLRVDAVDLPAGVTAETVTSEPKGDSAKAVKLKLQAAEAVRFQGTFGITATALDAKGEPTDLTRTATFGLTDGVRTAGLWLTVANPKEKKP